MINQALLLLSGYQSPILAVRGTCSMLSSGSRIRLCAISIDVIDPLFCRLLEMGLDQEGMLFVMRGKLLDGDKRFQDDR